MLDICRGHGEYWTFVGGTGNAGHSETHELIIHHALYDKSLRYQIVMRRTDKTLTKRKRTKGQTTIYKTPVMNSCAPEGLALLLSYS